MLEGGAVKDMEPDVNCYDGEEWLRETSGGGRGGDVRGKTSGGRQRR